MSELLPPNATAQERALDDSIARLGVVPVRVRDVWNPETCPSALLAWLAWAFSVDEWDVNWSDAQKRQTIQRSVAVHRSKGTIGAVREAVNALGIGAVLVEWFKQTPIGDPYTFELNLNAQQDPITQQQLSKLVDVVNSAKNLRSHLSKIKPGATSNAEVFVAVVPMVGSEIEVTGTGGTLKLDGTWALDASQIIDGFKRSETRTLNGAWSLNGATTLNGLSAWPT